MISKTDFLAGVPFHFMPGAKLQPYKFERWPDWKNGDPIGSLTYFNQNEANVTHVSYSYFDCYTTVLHKVIKVRINFKDLYL